MNNLMYRVGAAVGSVIRGFKPVGQQGSAAVDVAVKNNQRKEVTVTPPAADINKGLIMKSESWQINTAHDAAKTVWKLLTEMHEIEQDQEHMWVLGLTIDNWLIFTQCVYSGTLDRVEVHAREVFRMAIHKGARAIVLAHNHPNGDPTPSQLDIDTTRELRDAGKIIEIQIYEHIVIGNKTGNYRSLRKYCNWYGEEAPVKGEGA